MAQIEGWTFNREKINEDCIRTAHKALELLKTFPVVGVVLEQAIKSDIDDFFDNVEYPIQIEDIAVFVATHGTALAKIALEMNIPLDPSLLAISIQIMTGFMVERIHA